MRSFVTLYGPSIINSLPILQSIAKEFQKITGNTALREFSGPIQGNYDYVFDWHENPSLEQIMILIKLLDDRLQKTSVYFAVTTLETFDEEPSEIESENFVSYIKILGPGIFYTIEKLKNSNLSEISRHGLTEGYSDYFFEWKQKPTIEDISKLIMHIEENLPENFNVRFKITTKDSSLALRRLHLAQMMIYSHIPYI